MADLSRTPTKDVLRRWRAWKFEAEYRPMGKSREIAEMNEHLLRAELERRGELPEQDNNLDVIDSPESNNTKVIGGRDDD